MQKIERVAEFVALFVLIYYCLKWVCDGLALLGVIVNRTYGLLAIPFVLVTPYVVLPAGEGFSWYCSRAFLCVLIAVLLAVSGAIYEAGIRSEYSGVSILPGVWIILFTFMVVPLPNMSVENDTTTATSCYHATGPC
jgi:hypothetical protein